MKFILVFVGGGLGSVVRYTISLFFERFAVQFPLATLISNFLACLILISLTVVLIKENEFQFIQPLLIIGFCGGFSTFSTFSLDTIQLIQNGQIIIAILNVLISVLSCLGIIYFLSK
jgi:CrcB protein